MTLNLPTLYKKTATGATQFWSIHTEDATIVTRYGQCGGKEQETRDEIKEGKNTGKANETSAEVQAQREAQSQWEKKKTAKGYVETIEDALAGKVDSSVEGGIFPMLAHRYDEQGHKIKFPAYAQPKFDGHRCIATVVDGKCTLWSRTRKPILSMPHIVEDIEKLSRMLAWKTFTLDGELYRHDYREKFEELTSFIRQSGPTPGGSIVQYHVYDTATELEQTNRLATIDAIGIADLPSIKAVETRRVLDEDELMLAFDDFLAQGYEGAMVRNMDGLYVNKRSYDLQKIKEFKDMEFLITGIEEGRGKLAGHGIFVCKAENGTEFRAKMKGTLDSLKQYFEHPEKFIGKRLTVKYQGLSKYGVPRFPVALRIREDI